jgi:hypothetical protein
MGRAFDGAYAEYALVPDHQLIALDTALPWEVLGALPETFLTAAGSLQHLGLRNRRRSGVEIVAPNAQPSPIDAILTVGAPTPNRVGHVFPQAQHSVTEWTASTGLLAEDAERSRLATLAADWNDEASPSWSPRGERRPPDRR